MLERILARATRRQTGCREWARHCDKKGYGRVWHEGRQHYVHRLVWQLTRGPIPDGLCVLHSCDNPPCCEVDHLFLGTRRDNADDTLRKGRTKRRAQPREMVERVRREVAAGASRRAVARRYGLDRTWVTKVCNGTRRAGSA